MKVPALRFFEFPSLLDLLQEQRRNTYRNGVLLSCVYCPREYYYRSIGRLSGRKNRPRDCKGSRGLSRNRNTSGFPGLRARSYASGATRWYVERSENRLSGRGNGTGALWRHRISGVGVSMACGSFFPILSFVSNKKCRFNASKR